ncbi:hypothetical protein EC968_008922 [Mortierella alpina]|nr:hypothetical protein EC968_008922 [Mortierella alpina]
MEHPMRVGLLRGRGAGLFAGLTNHDLMAAVDETIDFLQNRLKESCWKASSVTENLGDNDHCKTVDLRQLTSFLDHRHDDGVPGSLYRTITKNSGCVKWMCLDHHRQHYPEDEFLDTEAIIEEQGGTFNEKLRCIQFTTQSDDHLTRLQLGLTVTTLNATWILDYIIAQQPSFFRLLTLTTHEQDVASIFFDHCGNPKVLKVVNICIIFGSGASTDGRTKFTDLFRKYGWCIKSLDTNGTFVDHHATILAIPVKGAEYRLTNLILNAVSLSAIGLGCLDVIIYRAINLQRLSLILEQLHDEEQFEKAILLMTRYGPQLTRITLSGDTTTPWITKFAEQFPTRCAWPRLGTFRIICPLDWNDTGSIRKEWDAEIVAAPLPQAARAMVVTTDMRLDSTRSFDICDVDNHTATGTGSCNTVAEHTEAGSVVSTAAGAATRCKSDELVKVSHGCFAPLCEIKANMFSPLPKLADENLRTTQAKFVAGNSPLQQQQQQIPTYTSLQSCPQDILEYDLQQLRVRRIKEYNQPVYIPLMAKANLQDSDKDGSPLMDMIKTFLKSDQRVFLVLGDPGAGKSTFSRHLEYTLWEEYETGGRIPLFIHLPVVSEHYQDIIGKQLQLYDFSKTNIEELKMNRQLVLICDGYDEARLMINLHTDNKLNEKRLVNTRMVISCRTNYLGQDYRKLFQPLSSDGDSDTAAKLYTEAVIVRTEELMSPLQLVPNRRSFLVQENSKHGIPRPRPTDVGSTRDCAQAASNPLSSVEFPVAIMGDLFVLDVRAKSLTAQNRISTWKRISCCIRSNGHFSQYNIGEDKPFETIPLADTLRTHIWPLDSSLFSKKHCFSIKASHDVKYYTVSLKRSSTDQETFNTWLHALKSYAKAEIFGASELLEYRLYRTFWIHVNDGRGLPKDLEAYCEIMLDDQRRARTSTRRKASRNSDPDTFWRDGFEFTDLAGFTKGITLNVIQAKGSKLIPFGRTYIPVRNSDECEGWYPILHNNDRTRSTEHLGDLRLKLKYEELLVLPLANYSELMEIIGNFRENNVITILANRISNDLEGFARNVLRILEAKDLAVVWLNSLIDQEIAEAQPARVDALFRGNTLLTKAMDAYMRMVGTEYLDDTLGEILREICKSKVACELRLTEKFPDVQVSGAPDFGGDLASLARYKGVSGFVFLRLICPAILGPRLFCIVKERPETRAHRTLTLIAKSLQGLANVVMFGAKEPWMMPMNEFITENTRGLKDFIDQICMGEPTSGTGSSSNLVRSILMLQAPHSPGLIHSAAFRSSPQQQSSKNDNFYQVSGAGFETSLAASCSVMAPLPSPSSQAQVHARFSYRSLPPSKDVVLPPTGKIDPATMDRNQDMPQLPHMTDLGKELAHFSTTVARVVSSLINSLEQEQDDLDKQQKTQNEAHSSDDVEILRKVGRACWDIIETIQERVELNVVLEQEERIRAVEAAQGANAAATGSFGGSVYVQAGAQSGMFAMSKVSREGSRDGQEPYVVYEHYDGDHDAASFDGYVRGYDSNEESFEQRPGYEQPF